MNTEDEITEEEIKEMVEQRLPQWTELCLNPEASLVVLHQGAFNNTDDEMFLLAAAIKYAGIAKKDVTITF